MDYLQQYNEWCAKVTDGKLLSELRSMTQDQIREAFGGELSFGTAGLRGIMSPGTARMNIYTVFRATEGLARYMDSLRHKSCAITYDSRNNSREFCELAAATLASHGIRVYLTPECMPTPFLSFMVRELKCDMGVNVTASHNPSEYNGYKVYGASGCQLLDDEARKVTEFIDTVKLFEQPLPDFAEYEGNLVQYTDELLEEMYIDRVLQERLSDSPCNNVNVVYTPLNGAGHRVVPKTLHRIGVDSLCVVREQAEPNGNFPTCPYPNPEKAEALALANRLAMQTNADLVVANDPDSDRLGVAVRDGEDFRRLSGNEVGVLLADYILNNCDAASLRDSVIVKTIVSTPMAEVIAAKHNVKTVEVLTGFKYIGNVVDKLESEGRPEKFLFGFEESCGYLKGSYVRDKDGVVAAMLITEYASVLKSQGKTLADRLRELYDEYGHYLIDTVSYRFDGLSGAERKRKLLRELRSKPFDRLGNSPVTRVCDLLDQTRYDLPKSDVLRLLAADGSQLIVRPSGTEPLVKCYITVKGKESDNQARFDAIKRQIDEFFA